MAGQQALTAFGVAQEVVTAFQAHVDQASTETAAQVATLPGRGGASRDRFARRHPEHHRAYHDRLVQRLQAKLTEAGAPAQGRTTSADTTDAGPLRAAPGAHAAGADAGHRTAAHRIAVQTGTVTAVTTTTLRWMVPRQPTGCGAGARAVREPRSCYAIAGCKY